MIHCYRELLRVLTRRLEMPAGYVATLAFKSMRIRHSTGYSLGRLLTVMIVRMLEDGPRLLVRTHRTGEKD